MSKKITLASVTQCVTVWAVHQQSGHPERELWMAGVDRTQPLKRGTILCMIIVSTELASRIKAARAKLGLSQATAAKAWQIPRRTIISWENNQRTPRGLGLKALNELLD